MLFRSPENPPTERELLEFLHGDQGRKEIERALAALRKLGIHGIPQFVIEGRTIVDGAAKPETFIRVFREIEKRGFVSQGTVFGDILGISEDLVARGSHHPTKQQVA